MESSLGVSNCLVDSDGRIDVLRISNQELKGRIRSRLFENIRGLLYIVEMIYILF